MASSSAQSRPSALRSVSPLVWVLLAIIVAMAVALGYMVGTSNSRNDAATQAEGSAAPSTQASPEGVAGKDKAEITKLAASVSPGTQFPDGSKGDAKTFGPGAPIKSAEDVIKIHRRDPADPFAIGAVDAPVVISEFSDFECPFCSRHANQTDPQLVEKYVDSGLVRIEWNDFPVNGPAAVEAAKAGRAAAAQGKFAEFKHELYTASKDINGHPEFGIDDFEKFARKAGVKDLDKFRQQATDDTFDEVVTNARSYASSLGITGTPAFVVGDQFISGAQPQQAFEEAIELQLAKVAAGEVQVPDAK